MTKTPDNLIRRWARAGVLWNVRPSRESAGLDLERLLLDTARHCPANPRLFVLAATWLSEYGIYVAGHRLKRLALTELDVDTQAALGLLLDTAVEHGAPKSLRQTVTPELSSAPNPGPLFEVDRGSLAKLVNENATATSKRWGRWTQPIEPKPDALRPPSWILNKNPEFAERAAHKGDLRCSVLQTLRHDVGDAPVNETELARQCAATPVAIRAALADLQRERSDLNIDRHRGRGGTRIMLRAAA